MVLVAYAGPVRPAAALRDSVLCLPTDIHSLFVNKPSSSSSSSRAHVTGSSLSLNGHSHMAGPVATVRSHPPSESYLCTVA